MKTDQLEMEHLMKELVKKEGSDLHLKVGAPPIMRRKFKLCILDSSFPIIDYQLINQLIQPFLTDAQSEKLKKVGSVELGYGLKGVGRFRFNICFQRGTLRAVIRHIPHKIPSFKDLNLLPEMLKIVNKAERGLILVAGASGVGKSTTLASLINHINKTKNRHIITIEDPIEFLIQDHYSLITQRELGVDCYDANVALKTALQQDPNIILISELRDKDTIFNAITAAETGPLVFGTIHTQEAAEAISRVVNIFSTSERDGVKMVLSNVLVAIFSQRLIPKKDKTGSIPIVEILVNNLRMQAAIEKNASTEKIREIMKQSKHHWGMQTFDQHLIQMLKDGLISKKTAIRYSTSPEKINLSDAGISLEDDFNQEKYNTGVRALDQINPYIQDNTNITDNGISIGSKISPDTDLTTNTNTSETLIKQKHGI